jgi:hypothetical protein
MNIEQGMSNIELRMDSPIIHHSLINIRYLFAMLAYVSIDTRRPALRSCHCCTLSYGAVILPRPTEWGSGGRVEASASEGSRGGRRHVSDVGSPFHSLVILHPTFAFHCDRILRPLAQPTRRSQ